MARKQDQKQIKFSDWSNNKRIYYELSNFPVFTVDSEKEGLLRIWDGFREGWVIKNDFILIADAPEFFSDIYKADPNQTWALYRRAVAWDKKGELDNAIMDYTTYLGKNPKDTRAYLNRGHAWFCKKEYDKALSDFNEAIRLDPNEAIAYGNRGNVWRGKKEYDKASPIILK
ncbi:tetratricopeptide repeat protein [Telmatocola sphagniphila]|uniref:Tetratricopeptide repeat protein n=1 Tax=Telmatocola sphagniphila TaxID=1123043 RepID=A0A8E6B1Z9_9BACT|nr:tetratricopeptide repeat protein [Telmatocola sphagniphila]QVL30196.1 tetratricopeptide repeat protein [Telmatocola sphagniphila]